MQPQTKFHCYDPQSRDNPAESRQLNRIELTTTVLHDDEAPDHSSVFAVAAQRVRGNEDNRLVKPRILL